MDGILTQEKFSSLSLNTLITVVPVIRGMLSDQGSMRTTCTPFAATSKIGAAMSQKHVPRQHAVSLLHVKNLAVAALACRPGSSASRSTAGPDRSLPLQQRQLNRHKCLHTRKIPGDRRNSSSRNLTR